MERPEFDHLNWQEEYSCNVAKLDDHRQKLIDIYNLMIEHYNARTCKDNITKPFFKLAFRAESFFFDLEVMLRELNYPKLSERKEKHKHVLNRIVKFKEDFSTQKETVCLDMLTFMTGWMENEVLSLDPVIDEFLKIQMKR